MQIDENGSMIFNNSFYFKMSNGSNRPAMGAPYINNYEPYQHPQMYTNPMLLSQIVFGSNVLSPQLFNHINNSYLSYNMPHFEWGSNVWLLKQMYQERCNSYHHVNRYLVPLGIFATMFGKFNFPRTPGEPGENNWMVKLKLYIEQVIRLGVS